MPRKSFVKKLPPEILKEVNSLLSEGRTRWVILSRGERQAREAMEEGVKLHLRAMNAAFKGVESDFRLEDRTITRVLEVSMKNGSRMTALPANPDTARGFSANVFLDEFAFHKDSHAIWKALFPVVSRNGLKLRITSTPNGKSSNTLFMPRFFCRLRRYFPPADPAARPQV